MVREAQGIVQPICELWEYMPSTREYLLSIAECQANTCNGYYSTLPLCAPYLISTCMSLVD